jgi:hypothetical protein
MGFSVTVQVAVVTLVVGLLAFLDYRARQLIGIGVLSFSAAFTSSLCSERFSSEYSSTNNVGNWASLITDSTAGTILVPDARARSLRGTEADS